VRVVMKIITDRSANIAECLMDRARDALPAIVQGLRTLIAVLVRALLGGQCVKASGRCFRPLERGHSSDSLDASSTKRPHDTNSSSSILASFKSSVSKPSVNQP
jgi:hypothetical protein